LLNLPAGVFKDVVPALIGVALVLVVTGPRLSRRLAAQRAARAGAGPVADADAGPVADTDGGPVGAASPLPGPVLLFLVGLAGVYGGYFGAAQGIILVALLSIFLVDELQRLNAAKNVLAFLVNGVAGVVFLIDTHINWTIAAIIAVASTIGGQLGAHYGRKLDPRALRGLIVVVGTAAIVRLLV